MYDLRTATNSMDGEFIPSDDHCPVCVEQCHAMRPELPRATIVGTMLGRATPDGIGGERSLSRILGEASDVTLYSS